MLSWLPAREAAESENSDNEGRKLKLAIKVSEVLHKSVWSCKIYLTFFILHKTERLLV